MTVWAADRAVLWALAPRRVKSGRMLFVFVFMPYSPNESLWLSRVRDTLQHVVSTHYRASYNGYNQRIANGPGWFFSDRSFCRSSADAVGKSSTDLNIFSIMKSWLQQSPVFPVNPFFFICGRAAVIDWKVNNNNNFIQLVSLTTESIKMLQGVQERNRVQAQTQNMV